MAGYSTKIVAEAVNPEGKVMARLTVEHMELDYAGVVKVEQSVQKMLDEQFSWGVQQASDVSSK
jgi:predicted methyltransferase